MPRLPWDGDPPITRDEARHLRDGSLPGEDAAMGVGTPLFAVFSGNARSRIAGTGGWAVTIYKNGRSDVVGEAFHLSRFVPALGGSRPSGKLVWVNEGDLIGFSGGARGHAGAGNSTGPHCHAHVYASGVTRPRQSVTNYIRVHGFAALATNRTTSDEEKETEKEEEDMPLKLIAPYGLPDRAVIGNITYAFSNPVDYAHFKNVWGLNDTPETVVGDAKSTPAQNRAIFNSLIKIHTNNLAGQFAALSSTLPAAVSQKVWSQPVSRDKQISALQELADAKTLALAAEAKIAALEAAVKAMSLGAGLDPQVIRTAAKEGAALALAGLQR